MWGIDMPIYDFECVGCHKRKEHWLSLEERNSRFLCECGKKMFRLPGGHGLLYFEESRPRTHIALSDKPITSKRQHERMMKDRGVTESGNTVPLSVAKNPKHPKMQEIVAGTQKGRWI